MELLLPSGNIESFYAALEGGADAVYLGLKKFSARSRAMNFSLSQLYAMTNLAKKENVKIYVTINTLLKQNEIPELMNTLHALTQIPVDAVIIQDWGIYKLMKDYFPQLVIHASTQMGIHNSVGTDFNRKKGFERVILSRELTIKEIESIARKSSIELEIFVHGALCYSFSGYCLYSSYLGGKSANRGECRQPCRRKYKADGNSHEEYLFNLSDLEVIHHVKKFNELGIASLKVEGRMKSAEYVYRVAQAYRSVLDYPDDRKILEAAREQVEFDFGRKKTEFFMGDSIKNIILGDSFTGIETGIVEKSTQTNIAFRTDYPLQIGNRIRVQTQDGMDSKAFKIRSMLVKGKKVDNAEAGDYVTIEIPEQCVQQGDKIFMTALGDHEFPSKIKTEHKNITRFSKKRMQIVKRKIALTRKCRKPELFVRVDSFKWLRRINIDDFDRVILKFTSEELKSIDFSTGFISKYISKFAFELPVFIPEEKLESYRILFKELSKTGVRYFIIQHVSQKMLIPDNSTIISGEKVYCMNDASVSFLADEGINDYVLPVENDYRNLTSMSDRRGIIPVYFYPELFISRVPVNKSEFKDRSKTMKLHSRNGMTITTPGIPVSHIHYMNKLKKIGFNRFLVDFSYTDPSRSELKEVMKAVKTNGVISGSTSFNYKRELT